MLEEVLVVALGEVARAGVGAAALPPLHPGGDHTDGQIEQVAELERLGEVAVEDLAAVVDEHLAVALAQAFQDLELAAHLALFAEDAEVLVHRGAQLVADRARALAFAAIEQLRQLALGVGEGGEVDLGRPGARQRSAGRGAPGPRPKTIVSISELPPSRLAPCSDTQATSPAAKTFSISVQPSTSVATPPM